ncbi:hypothetical protein BCE75_10768 [Isoptericola sp. CG 20/1183]|uniref:Cell division protein FtsL n=1 Tax=Isoptericola halotolerans TaxID=300560 RepID=A0ABX5ECL1_9MICO|nr:MULTISPECIES: hypothetical protein [Isoptericola]MCK0116615.1 hypothetical protein [Isoptericola sp. S6320L]PRZ05582.1 hypothetical protein BCL65_10768 [Isoptericola halotolerans]PRZ06150.1 hypothetical protein BCE75_10768 [Isoptericola sp. CG 20/1183]
MSALRAPATFPERRGEPTPRRAPLTAVEGGAGRRLDAVRAPLQATSGLPFMVLCALVLVGALFSALLLNTSMARGSYEMSRLQREVGLVAQDVQEVQAELRAAESSLPQQATRLGMVPAEDMTMLSVVEGTIVAGSAEEP